MAVSARTPDALLCRPFRGSMSVRMGLLTKRQLQSGAWRSLFKDVYVHESIALTHRTRCQAAALIVSAGGVISGASAAHLFGADVLALDAPVEVTLPRQLRLACHPGIVARYAELQSSDVVYPDGIPATTPVRTAFDLARRSGLEDAVVALDALLRACVLDRDAVSAYANNGRSRWHGTKRLAGVLALVAPAAESPMETRLRLALTLAGLPAPAVQHRVADESGRFIARLDLAYVRHRLGIEYDGECHWDPRALRRDLRRQNALRALGWSLLRFTATDVLHNRARLVAQVRAAAGLRAPA